MAPVSRTITQANISEGPARIIKQARCLSTVAAYQHRLKRFYKWCKERKIKPTQPSVKELFDFLFSLHEQGMKPNSIMAYRSAIWNVAPTLADGTTMDNNPLLTDFFKGLFIATPKSRLLLPAWDLTIVMQALTHGKFKGLKDLSLGDLTRKTVILLALVTLRRRSELAALSIKPGRCNLIHVITPN
jgi:site-specific recombinase XerD